MILTEKVPATRVTFVVDEDTYKYLSTAHGYSESDELWIWESSEDTEVERFIPCGDCGSRTMMEEWACPYNEGYCMDCCICPEHFPEENDIQLELPYED